MPPLHEDVFHKALSSGMRRDIVSLLAKKEMYLSELAERLKKKPQNIDFHLRLLEEVGLVGSSVKGGKKYYCLKDPRVADFVSKGGPVPPELRPKPPHEMVAEIGEELNQRMGRIEKRLERIEQILARGKK
ncbi:MAG: metalloregulator ArsR/SmtB family transcription factor [Candidatus Micrarchaeota archaeon]